MSEDGDVGLRKRLVPALAFKHRLENVLGYRVENEGEGCEIGKTRDETDKVWMIDSLENLDFP